MIEGRDLKLRRKSLGLSVKEAADAIGISYPTVRDFEAGLRRPQAATMAKIERWLGPGQPEATADEEEAPPPESEDGEEAAAPTGSGMADSALVLDKIDQALQALRTARQELAPDDGLPAPVKCRDIASLALRIAAIETALIKAGIALES